MIRSGTVNSIHELAAQGKSIHAITVELGLARNTVRKYLRGTSQIVPRPRRKRGSKLDPFKEQIKKWMTIDHCYNCESMFPRLQALGYTGSLSLLRPFVHALRPPAQGQHPVQRYETKPGEQMQFDWAEFKYEQDGVMRKLYGFAAILSYSRMRFVTFVKRCDTPTLLRCFMEACEYFGGLPKAALTDRMKSVILEMDGKVPKWNRFGCILHSLRTLSVSFDVCEHSSEEHVHRAVQRQPSHGHWSDTWEADLPVPSP